MVIDAFAQCFNIIIIMIIGSFVLHLIYLGWLFFVSMVNDADDEDLEKIAKVVILLIRCIICRFLVFLFEVNLSWCAVVITLLLWFFWKP